MAKNMKKHWDKKGSFNGKKNPVNNSNTVAKTGGRNIGGNVYKTEGGYRQSHVAGLVNGGSAEKASGKFGAASDVPAKLTFGRQSITEQAGFKNQITVMNNPEDGSQNGHVTYGYNSQVTAMNPVGNPFRSSGIMAVHIHDYLGANNNTEKSPLNLAAQLNKQFIDTSLGEQLTFSHCDLGIYFGGVKSAWDKVYHIVRAINTSHNVKDRADYRTKGLYMAMQITKESHPTTWVDPSYEIAGNAPVYLERLNASIKKLNTIPLPANLKWLVAYTESAYSCFYADADNDGAQLYVCVPAGWYQYDETATGAPGSDDEFYNGASLVWKSYLSDASVNDGYVSIPELLDGLETMVNALSTKTNSDMMAQKLFNAHGTANVLTMPTFATSDDLVPINYDEDFLEALENAKIIPEIALIDKDYTIDANSERIIGRPIYEFNGSMNPQMQHNVAASLVNIPLQFHCSGDQIDAHKVSNSLRWHPYFSFYRDDDNTTPTTLECDFANNFGMQLVTLIRVIYIDSSGDFQVYRVEGQNDAGHYLAALRDFKAYPCPVFAAPTWNSVTDVSLSAISYSSDRDTEVTIAGEDVANYFWSLAEMVWDTVDGQASFAGQRSKLG